MNTKQLNSRISNKENKKEGVNTRSRSKDNEENVKYKHENNIINNTKYALRKFGNFNENGKRISNDIEESENEESILSTTTVSIQSKKMKKGKEEIKNLFNNTTSSKNSNINSYSVKTCTICLDRINLSATIITCNHEFCVDCLNKWVEKASVCPLCRKSFDKFTYFDLLKNKKTKIVEQKEFEDFEYEEEFWYDNSSDKCMICSNSNNTHLMIICDECNYNVCHTYCTNLDKIPDGEWHCEECILDKYNNLTKKQKEECLKRLNEESEEELEEELEEESEEESEK